MSGRCRTTGSTACFTWPRCRETDPGTAHAVTVGSLRRLIEAARGCPKAVFTFSIALNGGVCCSILPLHEHCLLKNGIPRGELWHLAPLAE